MDWCRIYRTEGVAGLIDKRKGGNRDRFTEQQIAFALRQDLVEKARAAAAAMVNDFGTRLARAHFFK